MIPRGGVWKHNTGNLGLRPAAPPPRVWKTLLASADRRREASAHLFVRGPEAQRRPRARIDTLLLRAIIERAWLARSPVVLGTPF